LTRLDGGTLFSEEIKSMRVGPLGSGEELFVKKEYLPAYKKSTPEGLTREGVTPTTKTHSRGLK